MILKLKHGLKFILLLFAMIFLFFIFFHLKDKRGITLKMEKINQDYSGVVIKKYTKRKYTQPTHLDIKTKTGIISVHPNNVLVDSVNIGDSILKPKNENYAYLITSGGVKRKFFYTRLSFKTRKSKWFPKEWKNKWLESSEWDKEK